MKKLLTTVALFFSVPFIWSAAAAESTSGTNDNSIRRAAGYRGSISLTDQYLVWMGFDTSHGWMFDEHHYLGGGVGFFTLPDFWSWPTFAHVFVDYSAYILKRPSTPTAGVKAGCMMVIGSLGEDDPFEGFGQSLFEIEPNVGWSWAFNENLGMRLSIGATVLIGRGGYARAMPKLSVGFEF